MKQLNTGQFFGETKRRIGINGLTITDTEYTHEKVDWHYHENPYFTFILQGNVMESNKKETYHCSAGSLLFHNWDDAHYNIKPPGFTRGFQIELEQKWLDQWSLNTDDLHGSFSVKNPEIKLLFYQLFKESLYKNDECNLAIESLLLQVIDQLKSKHQTIKSAPQWIFQVRDWLHEESHDHLSLSFLSELFGIHPVHLSRYFPKFFGCSFGEYIRKIKVERSLVLLSKKEKQLIDIALECGFSDQSHFNRCFKENIGITPLAYRKFFP
jgi:AraC family transcriptional regulator